MAVPRYAGGVEARDDDADVHEVANKGLGCRRALQVTPSNRSQEIG